MSNLSIWLNNLAEIAQILAALAVIVTLIFIAVQVRETRRIASGGSYQTLLQNVNAFFNSLSTHEGLGRIYWNGRKDPSILDDDQQVRFFYLCVQWFCFFENLFLQYSHGLLPKEHFKAWCNALEEDLYDPGFLLYWQHEKFDYAEDFRNYVDHIIEAKRDNSNDKSIERVFSQQKEQTTDLQEQKAKK